MKWALSSLRILLVVFLGLALFQGAREILPLVPPEWNPQAPLEVAHPITPLTKWKLRRVLADNALCKATLASSGADFDDMPDLVESEQCHIKGRVNLRRVGLASMYPVQTTCNIALRTAMWEHHSLQPAASDAFGRSVAEIEHFSSYNCRRIRTLSGTSNRMSTHATAMSIDVKGFALDDGRRMLLADDWDGAGGLFLRQTHQGACEHFGLVLGPDYNDLHFDHFHIQATGTWCR